MGSLGLSIGALAAGLGVSSVFFSSSAILSGGLGYVSDDSFDRVIRIEEPEGFDAFMGMPLDGEEESDSGTIV